jgi:hypothetical protein
VRGNPGKGCRGKLPGIHLGMGFRLPSQGDSQCPQ